MKSEYQNLQDSKSTSISKTKYKRLILKRKIRLQKIVENESQREKNE